MKRVGILIFVFIFALMVVGCQARSIGIIGGAWH